MMKKRIQFLFGSIALLGMSACSNSYVKPDAPYYHARTMAVRELSSLLCHDRMPSDVFQPDKQASHLRLNDYPNLWGVVDK